MLFAEREARAAIGLWALIPTLFLFFAITLAVDPPTQLDKVRLGVAVLDAGVQTPQGQVSVGARLAAGLGEEVPVQVVQFATEAELREAVLGRDVSGGIVFPADMTRNLQGGQPVQLRVVKSDGNDPFTNTLLNNLSTQLGANLNAALPALLGGEPAPPLVSVASDPVAASPDFRFGIIPGTLVLPIWIATVAFSALMSRAGDRVRRRFGALQVGALEAGATVAGAFIVAGIITLDIALFAWHWELDYVGLWGFLWLGLVASAWLIQGTIRLVGLELGALLGVLALFVQQPVSGAAFPPAFAPDSVRWLTDISPLRYMVEGVRNLLIGGSTTPEMAWGLALLAGAGLLLVAGGIARLAFIPGKQHMAQPEAIA
jgi:uncharacterized phage infection (PIP) family protein YhgE